MPGARIESYDEMGRQKAMGTGQITKMGMALAAFLALASAAQADTYFFRYKPMVNGTTADDGPDTETGIGITLAGRNFSFLLGNEYSFDFKTLATVTGGAQPSDFAWELSTVGAGHAAPAGLTLDGGTGVYSGTPTTPGDYTFEVVATHPDTNGRTIYTIKVGAAALDVVQIAADWEHTCAVTVSGGVKCWGRNHRGQLGNGSTTSSNVPVDVLTLTSNVRSVTVGVTHSCAVTTSGALKCWGGNSYGELGNQTTSAGATSSPVDVFGLSSGVSMVDAGQWFTCAVHNGAAKCWGYNWQGYLGDGTTANKNEPVGVQDLSSGVSAIEAGAGNACALASGTLKCWGGNNSGQIGDGTTDAKFTPTDVLNLGSGVSSFSVGREYVCAVTTAQGAKCWGLNDQGQLGRGTSGNSSTPVDVSGLTSGVASVSAGSYHACAVLTNGAARCWGRNDSGQTGGSGSNPWGPEPVAGMAPAQVQSISTGGFHTCAKTSEGAKCFGNSYSGQVGDGTNTNRSSAVLVRPN